MHFRKPKSKLAILLLFIAFNGFKTYSQNNSEIALYHRFDSIVGKENLGINNGIRYINFYRTVDKSHSYYFTEQFSLGNLFYDNQSYNDIEIKYDVNSDVLVLKPMDEYSYLGIVLSTEKVASFVINTKKFVNINYGNSLPAESMNGYFQEIFIENSFTFYIKHKKTRKKIIDTKSLSDGEKVTYDEFTDKNTYFIKYNSTFYNINSKKEVITIFPDKKKEIKEYYSKNSELESSNKEQFLENLMKYINSLSANTSN